MKAGDLVVGGGTILLALLTYLSVRVARASLEAQDAPLVIGAPVPFSSSLAEQIIGLSFDPGRTGFLPDGYEPAFVMRLRNIGRGSAMIRDVRLLLDGADALPLIEEHVVVDPNDVYDAAWPSCAVPSECREDDFSGTLWLFYCHPNGRLLQTVTAVTIKHRELSFLGVEKQPVRRWSRNPKPRNAPSGRTRASAG
jgi:hypothetical protein